MSITREIPWTVWRLMLAYALMMAGTTLNILIAGIIGLKFAPSPSLATLPIACVVVGVATATLPTGKLLAIWGRRRVFVAYGILAIAAAGFASWSLVYRSFPLFCLAVFMMGWATAAGHQYRFAALEKVVPAFAAKATSILLLGGILAAFVGPELAVFGRDVLETPFAGSYLLLCLSYAGAVLLLRSIPDSEVVSEKHPLEGRPLLLIVRSPVVILAICASGVGYGVMSFLMTATPISMHYDAGHSLESTKFVIQSHIIAMYLPSLAYPYLLGRLGHRNMMFAGVFALTVSLFIALSGISIANYWWALVFLGLGWNFLFLGGTNILVFGYRPAEQFRVQSMNDFMVFSIQAIVSLSSGWFLFYFQWNGLLLGVFPLIIAFWILVWRSKAYAVVEAGILDQRST